MKLSYIDHIVLLVKDLKQTEKFYVTFLGEPSAKSEVDISWNLGETKLFFGQVEEGRLAGFDKENVGLNHLAFRVSSVEELKDYENRLNDAGIKNSGIQIDKYGGKEFIWFDDPDGIRLEFYLR